MKKINLFNVVLCSFAALFFSANMGSALWILLLMAALIHFIGDEDLLKKVRIIWFTEMILVASIYSIGWWLHGYSFLNGPMDKIFLHT